MVAGNSSVDILLHRMWLDGNLSRKTGLLTIKVILHVAASVDTSAAKVYAYIAVREVDRDVLCLGIGSSASVTSEL